MVGCMILGMALPTVAAYLVGVILFVPCIRPILLAGGMADFTSNLCANMFVFYYGIMARSRRRCAWRRIQRRVSRTPTP